MKLLKTKSLGYNDVNLIAKYGVVKSRKEIPIEGCRIFVSPMTSVVGPNFIKALKLLPIEIRPTLCIPRDKNIIENTKLAEEFNLDYYICVGLKYQKIDHNQVLIDVANGHHPDLKELVEKYQDECKSVIVGNIHSHKYDLGYADMLRVGIGGGSVCTTKSATGYTRGQITEIDEISKCTNIPVMADGGIKTAGDIVKAFGAGANFVMLGGVFAETFEANNTGQHYGMASKLGKESMGSDLTNIEGKSILIEQNISLEELLNQLWDGIRSGISYSGYKDISGFIGNGVFEEKK